MTRCWRLDSCDPVWQFIPAAARVLKGSNVVCIEHSGTIDPALELYARYRTDRAYWPLRDTISPHTALYYCRLVPEFADELQSIAESHDLSDFLWHIRGYDGKRMIFYSHDACDASSIWITPRFQEGLASQLASEAGSPLRSGEAGIEWDTLQAR